MKDELEEAYERDSNDGGYYEDYYVMRKDNVFLSFDNFPLAFWKALACPLDGECSLSLLVSQFQGS